MPENNDFKDTKTNPSENASPDQLIEILTFYKPLKKQGVHPPLPDSSRKFSFQTMR